LIVVKELPAWSAYYCFEPQSNRGKNLQPPKPERKKGGKNRTGNGWTEASRTRIQKRMSTHTRRVVPHEVERLAQHLNVRSDDLQLIIRQEKRFERVAASGGGGKGPALDKSIA
jgi:hypothetical protein